MAPVPSLELGLILIESDCFVLWTAVMDGAAAKQRGSLDI
jgi:hypothetical protein